jgi:type I restriction enzyme M protein
MVDMTAPKLGETIFDPACGTGGFLANVIDYVRSKHVQSTADEQRLQSSLRAVEKKSLPYVLCLTNMLLHGIEKPSWVRHDNTLSRPLRDYGPADQVDVVITNPPFGGMEEDGIETNFPATFRTRETADLFLVLILELLKDGGRAAVVLPDGSLFGEGVKTRIKETLLTECNLHTIVRLPNSVFSPYASIGTNLLFFTKGQPTEEIWYYQHHVVEGQKAYSKTKPIKRQYLDPIADWWNDREESENAWKISIEEIRERGYNLDVKNPNEKGAQIGDPDELLAQLQATESEAAQLRGQLKDILTLALTQ